LPDTLIHQAARPTTRIVEGKRAAILERISSRDVALAIWTRQVAGEVADWLDALPSERLPDGRFVATPAEVPQRLAVLCDLVGLADSPGRAFLIDDVAALATRFARLSGSLRVDVRLEAIDHDSCWRFHRDHVGLRLNATYRGPGTQWPPLSQAARAARAQRRYRGPLNELPRFAVGLFKGALHAGGDAVLHRSPPVAGSGVTRLFLCMNEDTISL
jgi:hypothetical protein